jgi:hypothetical protein
MCQRRPDGSQVVVTDDAPFLRQQKKNPRLSSGVLIAPRTVDFSNLVFPKEAALACQAVRPAAEATGFEVNQRAGD